MTRPRDISLGHMMKEPRQRSGACGREADMEEATIGPRFLSDSRDVAASVLVPVLIENLLRGASISFPSS
jgi:hypothetical protein